jgi:integrase
MASIFERKGILYIEYYDKAIRAGKMISLKLKDNRENRKIANVVKKKFETDAIPAYKLQNKKINTPKFSELFEKYLTEKDYKKSTSVIYRESEKVILEALGDRAITEYSEEDNLLLRAYYKKKNHSQNTQSIRTRAIKSFFNWCVRKKIINENPIEHIKEESKPVEIIPKPEFEKLLEYAKSKNKHAYYFMKFLEMTGFRRSTALELKWEQINFNEKFIAADNVKKDRVFEFPLTDDLINLLKEMEIKKDGNVFSYKKGGLKFWYRYQRLLEFPKIYGLHQIRKTFISRLVNENYSLYDVAVLADHKSIKTTLKHYTKANINRIREQLNGRN